MGGLAADWRGDGRETGKGKGKRKGYRGTVGGEIMGVRMEDVGGMGKSEWGNGMVAPRRVQQDKPLMTLRRKLKDSSRLAALSYP